VKAKKKALSGAFNLYENENLGIANSPWLECSNVAGAKI
jgi:hypothetical protein